MVFMPYFRVSVCACLHPERSAAVCVWMCVHTAPCLYISHSCPTDAVYVVNIWMWFSVVSTCLPVSAACDQWCVALYPSGVSPRLSSHLTTDRRAESSHVEGPTDEVTVPPGNRKLPSRAPQRTQQELSLPLLLRFLLGLTLLTPSHTLRPLAWRRPVPSNICQPLLLSPPEKSAL